jgi:Pregnancy-associated plasma protein-A
VKKLLFSTCALLALTATVAAATASTAGGSSAAPAVATALCPEDIVDSLTPLARTTGDRPFREPVLRHGPSDSEIGGNGPKTSGSFGASVPVYFHVIHNGTTGNVSNDTIAQQMNVLDLAFDGFYGGADTGFDFTLAGVDRTDNAAWFDAEPGSPEEFAMKGALKQGGPTALNIYSTSGAQDFFLGWAYFPKINVYQKTFQVLDGVVIHWGSMPGGPFGNAFSLGQTATHETGHWLGLYHTFERGCQAQGDRIDDTPDMFEPTSGCPEGKDTCPSPGTDPIHNYMDYSFDSCYEEFTADQSDRMQQQYLHWRLKRA